MFLVLQHSNSLLVLQMIVREQGRDALMCWIFRAVGFVLCWISFSLILQPVCIFLKVIPALFHLCGMYAYTHILCLELFPFSCSFYARFTQALWCCFFCTWFIHVPSRCSCIVESGPPPLGAFFGWNRCCKLDHVWHS